jgi:hypothetical protein
MSRLPVPGGDNDTWGATLNDFLSTSLNADGTIKASGVSTAGAEMIANKGSAGGYASLDTTSKVPIAQVPTGATSTTVALGMHTHTIKLALTSFSKNGALNVSTGTARLPIEDAYTIIGTRLNVGTAPTGSNLVLDILKNGSTIYTTTSNRPFITAGSNSGGPGATPDVTSLVAGDYITVNILQVGSTIAGSDLTVSVIVSKSIS